MPRTSLDDLPELSLELRSELRSRWITTVEELRQALAAVPVGETRERMLASGGLATVCRRLHVWDGPSALTSPAPRGGLGLLLPAATLTRLTPGRPRFNPTQLLAMPEGLTLPREVNFAPRFDWVRNQGTRGTCVAFATVALREFLADFSRRFSEQFFYWACKQLDGSDQSGTTLAHAATALERTGICLEESWPYDPQVLSGNESHHPPPAEAVAEARKFRLAGWRLINGQDVWGIKRALAGSEARPGTPVVIGVAVYESSFGSLRAAVTGEISLPFPAEAPSGGHAMCAVGYHDDHSVPGGGFFIVRNSWGPGWASSSRFGAGHALLPYAYLAEFGIEAFTAPDAAPPALTQSRAKPNPFARYLDRRSRDLPATDRREWLNLADTQPQGSRLPEGKDADVLVQPLRPREFRADTPENRERFLRQWCAWSIAGADQVAQAAIDAAAPEIQSKLNLARQNRERCLGALDANLTSAQGHPFPYLRQPWAVKLAPYEWDPKVTSVKLAADLTDQVLTAWELQQRPKDSEPWPAPIRRLLRETCGIRVYELTGFNASVHVVVAWLTPIRYRLEGTVPRVELMAVDGALSQLVREVYDAWRSSTASRRPHLVFFSAGFAGLHGTLPTELRAVVSGDHWEIYWTHDQNGVVAALPDRVSDRRSLREFTDRLLPVTDRERVAQVKSVVDELRDDDYGGRITVDLVRKRTGLKQLTSGGELSGFRQSAVLDAFLKLQAESPDRYRVEKEAKDDDLTRPGANVGKVRILTPGEATGAKVTFASMQSRFWRKHGLRLLAMAVTGGIALVLATWNERLGLTNIQSFVVFLPLVYLGNLAGAWLNRHADRSEG